MNKIENYIKENFGEVRAFKDDNDIIWFVAGDIAKCLNYSSTQKVTEKVDEEYMRSLPKTQLTNLGNWEQTGGKDVIIICESGLYQVIGSITKKNMDRYDKAKDFTKWLNGEILPNIRRTGGFVEENREEEFIDKHFSGLSEETKKAMVKDLVAKNAELNKKAKFFDDYLDKGTSYSFTETAKLFSEQLLKENKSTISSKALTEKLREKGIISKVKKNSSYSNLPNKNYEKYFKVVDSSYTNKYGKTIPTTQTRVNAEGLEFIYSLINE